MASFPIKLEADDTDLDRVVERGGQKLDRLADKAANISLGGSSGGMGSGRGGGSRGVTADPWARHEAALEDLNVKRGLGLSEDALKSERLAEIKTGASVSRAERQLAGQTTQGRIMDALMTSRIGAGGLMPLTSRLAAIAGPEALAGVGLVAGGAYLYQQGADSIHALGSAHYIAGGTERETGQLASMGAFLGQDPAAMAGRAMQLSDALHGATYGAGAMRGSGIVDTGGLMTDKAKNYIKAVHYLQNEPDEGRAIRIARDVGMSDELWTRDLDPDQRKTLDEMMSNDSSPAERHAEASYRLVEAQVESGLGHAARSVVNESGYELAGAGIGAMFGGPIGAAAGAFIGNRVGDSITEATKGNAAQGQYNKQFARDQGWFLNSMKAGMEWLMEAPPYAMDEWNAKHFGTGPTKDGKGLAAKTTTETGAIPVDQSVRTQPGQSGGGPRVASSFPSSVRNQQFSENAQAYGHYVGGYVN